MYTGGCRGSVRAGIQRRLLAAASSSRTTRRQTTCMIKYARNSSSFERWNRGLMSYRTSKILVYGVICAEMGCQLGHLCAPVGVNQCRSCLPG